MKRYIFSFDFMENFVIAKYYFYGTESTRIRKFDLDLYCFCEIIYFVDKSGYNYQDDA